MIFGSTEGSLELRQAFPALQTVETPLRNEESFYEDLIAHFDVAREAEPTSNPLVLRFPFQVVEEYPDAVNAFVARHSWAEWHKGPSVVQEDFEDLLRKSIFVPVA